VKTFFAWRNKVLLPENVCIKILFAKIVLRQFSKNNIFLGKKKGREKVFWRKIGLLA